MRPILLLSLLSVAAPLHAQQIHRCTGPDGTAVFTDRRCEDVGALARLPPATRLDGEAGLYRHGCPRRLSELVDALRSAIDAHDVNRLSSVYLWPSLSDQAANRVLTQLEAIAERPLVDIAPLYPEARGPLPPDAATAPPSSPRPWGLRLEQTLANNSTPSHTILTLRRQYNCFWVSF
ncbi:hypothetical protein [[Pseudomonas] boreopolis]|uniref:DUF4124 domain-containing protein n=1 Tax=Xanthomonas boreopolis TaxID=86183 RepID=A0A919F523_9XANT|nr:hypothetical protein GCM10009090_03240 [[Pseudomonas] boreopolis]